jgi:hypothetical protein
MTTEEAYLTEERIEAIRRAMWEGDVDKLQEIAACRCCCHEHTFAPYCPAYQWGGCRGQGTPDEKKLIESYKRFYMEERGMTEDEFYATNRTEGTP